MAITPHAITTQPVSLCLRAISQSTQSDLSDSLRCLFKSDFEMVLPTRRVYNSTIVGRKVLHGFMQSLWWNSRRLVLFRGLSALKSRCMEKTATGRALTRREDAYNPSDILGYGSDCVTVLRVYSNHMQKYGVLTKRLHGLELTSQLS